MFLGKQLVYYLLTYFDITVKTLAKGKIHRL